jgi:hypothetical protein
MGKGGWAGLTNGWMGGFKERVVGLRNGWMGGGLRNGWMGGFKEWVDGWVFIFMKSLHGTKK